MELHDGEVPGDSPIASYPPGFRAGGPDVREASFTYGERTFTLRLAPLAGNPILTEQTIPASLVLAVGVAVSVLPGTPLCVALLDLDHFKAYNDRHGTCSVGLAAWEGHETATQLVARADRALYAAKEGGRNRSCAAPAAAESPAWSPAS